MKTAAAVFLSTLTAQAAVLRTPSAHSLRARQYDALSGNLAATTTQVLPDVKPAKIEYVTPVTKREGVKRVRIYYGPYTLLPSNATKPRNDLAMDPNSASWNNMAVGIPVDASVLLANTTLQYDNGKLADLSSGVYIHHVAFISTTKKDPRFVSCPGETVSGRGGVSSTFMGASSEIGASSYSTPDGKFNSGYYINKSDRFMMSGEIVNYTNDTKVVYSVSDIEYLPGRPANSLDASVQVLSVTQCDSSDLAIHAPPGQKAFSYKSKDMTVLHDGYVMGRRGHLHDGGVDIDMKVNGKTICDSRAIYGGEKGTMKGEDGRVWETVSDTSECTDPVKVSKGDVVVLQANYDLVKHPARKHANGGMAEEMGIMSFSFATL